MKVFVYGTLKKGKWNNNLLSRSKFLHKGKLKGYRLYNVSGLPMIYEEENGIVEGEFWEVSNEDLVLVRQIEKGYIETKINDFIVYVGNDFFKDIAIQTGISY